MEISTDKAMESDMSEGRNGSPLSWNKLKWIKKKTNTTTLLQIDPSKMSFSQLIESVLMWTKIGQKKALHASPNIFEIWIFNGSNSIKIL